MEKINYEYIKTPNLGHASTEIKLGRNSMKKLMMLMMAALVALALVGCGTNKNNDNNTTENNTVEDGGITKILKIMSTMVRHAWMWPKMLLIKWQN